MMSVYSRRVILFSVGVSPLAGCIGGSESVGEAEPSSEETPSEIETTTEQQTSWFLSAEVDPRLPSDVEPVAYPKPQQENEHVTEVLEKATSSAVRGERSARIGIQQSQADSISVALEPYRPESHWTAVVEYDRFVFQLLVVGEE
jgi:hypothetical protein